eukprot:5840130-Prorocentrum_lima.AAC.1
MVAIVVVAPACQWATTGCRSNGGKRGCRPSMSVRNHSTDGEAWPRPNGTLALDIPIVTPAS